MNAGHAQQSTFRYQAVEKGKQYFTFIFSGDNGSVKLIGFAFLFSK
jgi:hypothetical protein